MTLVAALLLALVGCDDPTGSAGDDASRGDVLPADRGPSDVEPEQAPDSEPEADVEPPAAPDARVATDAEPAADAAEPEPERVAADDTCADIARCAVGCVGLPADGPGRDACLASCVMQGEVASRDDYLTLLQCATAEGCGPPSDLPASVACVSERCERAWDACGYDPEPPPPDALTCVEFAECRRGCGEDDACRRGCIERTSSADQLAYRELAACASFFECVQGDDTWDPGCIVRHCAIARRRCDPDTELTCAQALRCRAACPEGPCPGCMPAAGPVREAVTDIEACIDTHRCHDEVETSDRCIRENCGREMSRCLGDVELDCATYDRCPTECRGESLCIALCEMFASPSVVQSHLAFEACRVQSGCVGRDKMPTRNACLQRTCLTELEACYGNEFELYCGAQLRAMETTAGLAVDWFDERNQALLEDWWPYFDRYAYHEDGLLPRTEPLREVRRCVSDRCPMGRCTAEQLQRHCSEEVARCNALNALGTCKEIIDACGTQGSWEDEVCSWGADPKALSIFDSWRRCRQFTCAWNDDVCAESECRAELSACEGSTCLGLALCQDGCDPEDPLCSRDCLAASREDAVGRYAQLVECNVGHGCDDLSCGGRACIGEFTACFGWRPQGLDCDALDLNPSTCDRACQAAHLRDCIDREACALDEDCRLGCMTDVVNCVSDWRRDGTEDVFICPLYDECALGCGRYDAECHSSCRTIAADTCMTVESCLDFDRPCAQQCQDVSERCEARGLCREATRCKESCDPLDPACPERCASRITAICASRYGCLAQGTHELLCLPEACVNIFEECIDPPEPLDCGGFGACIERCEADCVGQCDCEDSCAERATPAAPGRWNALTHCMRWRCDRITGPNHAALSSACAAVACDDELQACFPAAPDPPMPPAPPTCAEINDCLEDCPANDVACGRDCVASISAAERAHAESLLDCALDQNTISPASMAVEPGWTRSRCEAEFVTCFGPPLDCHGLEYCLIGCDARPACEDGCMARAEDERAVARLAALAEVCNWPEPTPDCLRRESALATDCYGSGLDCGEYLECRSSCGEDSRCGHQCDRRYLLEDHHFNAPSMARLGQCAAESECSDPSGEPDPVCLKLSCPDVDPWTCLEHRPEHLASWTCVDMALEQHQCHGGWRWCLDESFADAVVFKQRATIEGAYECISAACGMSRLRPDVDCPECADEIEGCFGPPLVCSGLDACLGQCDGRIPCESRCIERAAATEEGWSTWHRLWTCASERCGAERVAFDHECARRECADGFVACFGEGEPLEPEPEPEPVPPLDCMAVLECTAGCADADCVERCRLRIDLQAIDAFLALDACIVEAGCPHGPGAPIDEACTQEACREALEACVEPVHAP